MPTHRVTVLRRFLAVSAGLTTLTAGLVVATTPSGAAIRPAARYAVSRPVCNRPADPDAMRCFAVKRVPAHKGTRGAYRYRPAAARGPAGGYTPAALAKAYGYSPRTNRSKLTVGIVLWHDAPSVLADLNRFDKRYGLKKETSRSFRKVNEHGKSAPLPRRDRGAAGEIALDTQAVRAVCNTCRILLVEADGPYAGDLANAVNTAVRLGADVVTNSYGTPERRLPKRVLDAYNHSGVVLVASSGDAGWYGWDYANDPRDIGDGSASFPGTSPYVVSVGGTTLKLDVGNRRRSETVWNADGPHDSVGLDRQESLGASGGGCSKLYAPLAFQSHYPGYAAAHCNGKRLAVDVAMVADPATGFDVYDSYGSGGWVTIGGTSLSAPLVAGLYALAGGARGAAYPASAVYGNARAYPSRRYDVRSGGTGFCGGQSPATCSLTLAEFGVRNPNTLGMGRVDCSYSARGGRVPPASSRECNATAGYDGPSGVGTPTRTNLFGRTAPYVSISAPARPKHARSLTFGARVRHILPGTRATSYRWTWDGRSSTVSTSRTVRHTFAKKGRHTVSLKVTDSRYQAGYAKRPITVR